MSFFVKDDEIWDVIKNIFGIKFHSKPIYEQIYLKAKVRESDSVRKTNFLGNDTPKENMHYTWIACITIDSVTIIDKKNHLQVYLEECKYRTKKIKMPRFINTELKSNLESQSDSEAESKSDTGLMAKLNLILILNKSFYFQSSRFSYFK